MTQIAPQQSAIAEPLDFPRPPAPHLARARRTAQTLAVILLTFAVLLIHGYHPLADDGAIYVSAIQKLVDPGLYQPDAVFVASSASFSIFPHILAGLVRFARIPLPILLFLCHLASILLFLLGCSMAARRIFTTSASRWGALLLAACCFTLPVAGTALFLMDPYVTARSFSTPLSLFALAATLDEAWVEATLWLALAASLHPLMAGYAAIFLFALALAKRGMRRWLAAFALLGLLACAVLFLATRHLPLDSAPSQSALSRSYFFLSTWEWYQYPGLVLPLLLFLLTAWHTRGKGCAGGLSVAATLIGSCALAVALCFIHRSGSFLLARLQVLRAFHMIYLVGVLLIGGLLGSLARRHIRVGISIYAVVLLAMFAGQRLTYPASNPVEWPGLPPRNPWQQAFVWIRSHTPKDAVFAMDAGYIRSEGEDAQGFRASTERSALADWYKDGGIAAIYPAAQEPWWHELQATEGLNQATDAERIARVKPWDATWILLPARAATNLPCPYTNEAVRVCRLIAR